MKRIIVILAVLASVAFIGSQVLAWAGGGYGKGGFGHKSSMTNEQHARFVQETEPLRSELWQVRAQRQELLNQGSPSQEKLQELNQKIAELQTKMQLKAKEHAGDWQSRRTRGNFAGPCAGQGYGYRGGPHHRGW